MSIDSSHQAELERYQGHIKLDDKYPFHGAHGRLPYDLPDKNWIPHIEYQTLLTAKLTQKTKYFKKLGFLIGKPI